MITKLSYFINVFLKKQINHTVCHHNINSVSNSLYRIQKIKKKIKASQSISIQTIPNEFKKISNIN